MALEILHAQAGSPSDTSFFISCTKNEFVREIRRYSTGRVTEMVNTRAHTRTHARTHARTSLKDEYARVRDEAQNIPP